MKHTIKLLTLLLIFIFNNIETYAFNNNFSIDTANHFYSLIDKTQFDSLRGTDFTWAIYKPVNDTISFIRFRNRDSFIKKLFIEQKVLFYIWQLEGAVRQGELGFSNFYYNYKKDLPEIIKSLKLINDTAMLNVMNGANKIYLSHNKKILQDLKCRDWKYTQKQFSFYDKEYLDKSEHTMKLLESYIRRHANKIIKYK